MESFHLYLRFSRREKKQLIITTLVDGKFHEQNWKIQFFRGKFKNQKFLNFSFYGEFEIIISGHLTPYLFRVKFENEKFEKREILFSAGNLKIDKCLYRWNCLMLDIKKIKIDELIN